MNWPELSIDNGSALGPLWDVWWQKACSKGVEDSLTVNGPALDTLTGLCQSSHYPAGHVPTSSAIFYAPVCIHAMWGVWNLFAYSNRTYNCYIAEGWGFMCGAAFGFNKFPETCRIQVALGQATGALYRVLNNGNLVLWFGNCMFLCHRRRFGYRIIFGTFSLG